MNINSIRNNNKGKAMAIVLTVIVVLMAALSVFAFLYVKKITSKKDVNPFDYLSVSFEGKSGEAKAVLEKNRNADIDASKIIYKCQNMSALKAGDTITVTAESNDYNLTETSKEYKVEGLDGYIKNLDELSEDNYSVFHKKLEEEIAKDSKNIFNTDIISQKTCATYLCAKDDSNKLYDMYETSFMRFDSTLKYVYYLVEFDNVELKNNHGIISVNYSDYKLLGQKLSINALEISSGYVHGFAEIEDAEAYIAEANPGLDIMKVAYTHDED